MSKRVFLVCPVRNVTPEDVMTIAAYVESLEAAGATVHWPMRDTPQDDPVGLAICRTNTDAIREATEVHIWWSPESTGTLFDIGATMALGKPVVLANRIEPTPHKSFANVVIALAAETAVRGAQ